MPDLTSVVRALGIDVPVLRVKETDRGLTLYLYGGRVMHWKRRTPAQQPADLTAVWGIGRKTAEALRQQGIGDVEQLLAVHRRGELAQYLKPATRRRVEDWFAAQGYS